MNSACKKSNNCMTRTTSPVFELSTRLPGYLETRTPWFSACVAGEKTICGVCGRAHRTFYDRKVRGVRDLSCGDRRVWLEVEIRRVWCRRCGEGEQERLDWLGGHAFCPQRFFSLGGWAW